MAGRAERTSSALRVAAMAGGAFLARMSLATSATAAAALTAGSGKGRGGLITAAIDPDPGIPGKPRQPRGPPGAEGLGLEGHWCRVVEVVWVELAVQVDPDAGSTG